MTVKATGSQKPRKAEATWLQCQSLSVQRSNARVPSFIGYSRYKTSGKPVAGAIRKNSCGDRIGRFFPFFGVRKETDRMFPAPTFATIAAFAVSPASTGRRALP